MVAKQLLFRLPCVLLDIHELANFFLPIIVITTKHTTDTCLMHAHCLGFLGFCKVDTFVRICSKSASANLHNLQYKTVHYLMLCLCKV